MPRWPTEFHAFTLFHGAIVLVCIAAIAVSCYHGRCHRETPREARFRRTWGWFVLVTQVVYQTYWLLPGTILPGTFNIREGLPLQLCDLAGFVAPIAMIWHHRPARTLLYFWGLCLSSQALITPTLDHGPDTLRFWFFWLTHVQIIGSAVYDLVVGGYRPNGRDYIFTLVVSSIYAATVIAVNLGLDTNYGYLGERLPDAWTPLSVMGPWPWRPVILVALASALLAQFWLIWPLVRFLSKRPGPGRCSQCGYNRTGLAPRAPCPRCGAPVSIPR